MPASDEQKKSEFLEYDLYDALRWLFVGAVAWQAATKDLCPHQRVLGMYTSLVQARALYEFFFEEGRRDDARAGDFAPRWAREESNNLYSQYMAKAKPANKRVFHLVYDRSAHAGGAGHDGPEHLNNQVLKFARDLRRLTEAFVECAAPRFRDRIQCALRGALDEANRAAEDYGIANPL
jgi:hypothetical protein